MAPTITTAGTEEIGWDPDELEEAELLEESAFSLLQKIERVSQQIVDEETLSRDSYAIVLRDLQLCLHLVHQEGLFSKNEELDDVPTSSLKYLKLQYLLGKVLCQQQDKDISKRRDFLMQAIEQLQNFLDSMSKLRVIDKEEMDAFDTENEKKLSAEAKRNAKIAKFKKEKALKARIQELQSFFSASKEDGDNDHEEELRELFVSQLQQFCYTARDDIGFCRQEIEMLNFKEQLDSNNSDPHKRIVLPPPVENKGIEVTRTYKVGDKIMMSRETIHATVFQPRMEGPTMSLEEYGDRVKQEAEERAAAQAEAQAEGNIPKKYKELLAEGKEDEMDLVDVATIKDRNWDDWKDNNPKGWGNKLGKRF